MEYGFDVEPTVALKWTKTTSRTGTKYTFTGQYFKGNGGTAGADEHALFRQQQMEVFKHKVPNMTE